jgi:hypothetical protein
VATAPPPAAPAAPSAAALLEKERPAILGTLNRYAAAYRDKDMNALRNVYRIQREESQALERQWRNCRAFDVRFGDMEIAFTADGKRVTVQVPTTYLCTPPTGQRPPVEPVSELFVLDRAAGTWVIDSRR